MVRPKGGKGIISGLTAPTALAAVAAVVVMGAIASCTRKAGTPAQAPAAASALYGKGTIRGIAVWQGAAPAPEEIKMSGDPQCAARHKGGKLVNQSVIVGPNKGLANVLVRVIEGIPADANYPAPDYVAELDQNGCAYSPRLVAIQRGQKIRFKNSDQMLHNVHSLSKVNEGFNFSMPGSLPISDPKVFDKAEGIFTVKCDIHPWMQAFVAVSAHPFFTVTGADGTYTISNLPSGTYLVEGWHEKGGSLVYQIKVKDGEMGTVNFPFGG